jgi:hypothetical protein
MRIYPSQEDAWLWRHLQSQDCTSSQLNSSGPFSNQDCIHIIDKMETEDDLHVALRAEDILTASQAVVLLAQALQLAWEDVCFDGNRHPCPELIKMSHQDFRESYFTKVLQNQTSDFTLPQQNKDWLKELSSVPDLLLVEYIRNDQHKGVVNLHKVGKNYFYYSFSLSCSLKCASYRLQNLM